MRITTRRCRHQKPPLRPSTSPTSSCWSITDRLGTTVGARRGLALVCCWCFLVVVTASSLSSAESSLPPHIQAVKRNYEQQQQRHQRILQQVVGGDDESSTPPEEDSSPERMAVRQRLRNNLLANYDRTNYPFEEIWQQQQQQQQRKSTINEQQQQDFNRTGIQVRLGLNFHRVFSVDVANAVVDLVVWVRQSWNDPRLAWNEEEYDGITDTHFFVGEGSGAGGEMSQIWTPDLELWNQETSLVNSLADAFAQVSSDGTVFWSRPGHIRAVCKFRGLEDFPFDLLSCTLELGSWTYSGLYLRPVKLDEGFTLGGSETAGESFAEYSLESVECEEREYPPFPSRPEEDWPVVLYHVTFRRAWQPYARGYLVVQIVLNLAAFCAFWLPPHVGERMSLSITSLLAAIASELVISDNLPNSREMTWFARFSMVSISFTALALFESAAVIYFHYHTGDDLVPVWVRWVQLKWFRLRHPETVKEAEKPKSVRFDEAESPTTEGPDSGESMKQSDVEKEVESNGDQPPATTENGVSDEGEAVRDTMPSDRTSSCADNEEQEKNNSEHAPSGLRFNLRNNNDSADSGASGRFSRSSAMSSASRDDSYSSSEALFEHSSSNLGNDESQGRSRPQRFSEILKKSNGPKRKAAEFASSFRTRKSIKTILGRDADDFKNAKEMENNSKWQRVSHMIDDAARVIFPVAFSICLMILLTGLDL